MNLEFFILHAISVAVIMNDYTICILVPLTKKSFETLAAGYSTTLDLYVDPFVIVMGNPTGGLSTFQDSRS